METLNLLITALISAGGLGFINYFILAKLGKINIYEDRKNDKNLLLVLFSVFNYCLYLIVFGLLNLVFFLSNYYFDEKFIHFDFLLIPTALIITFFITILLSFKCFPSLLDKAEDVLNDTRNKEGLSNSYSKTVNDDFFSKYKNAQMFVYDFDNNLIFSGIGYRWSSSSDKTTEFAAVPFNEKVSYEEYDDLLNFIRENKYESDVLINIDKKLKIIVII